MFITGKNIIKHIITEKTILDTLEDEDSTEAAGLGSAMGRRRAYQTLMKQQRDDHGECQITFFNLLTYYSFKNPDSKSKKKQTGPSLLIIDSLGE